MLPQQVAGYISVGLLNLNQIVPTSTEPADVRQPHMTDVDVIAAASNH